MFKVGDYVKLIDNDGNRDTYLFSRYGFNPMKIIYINPDMVHGDMIVIDNDAGWYSSRFEKAHVRKLRRKAPSGAIDSPRPYFKYG